MRNDPREIIARFDSVCAETGKPIRKGDRCAYYPTAKKVFHVESNPAHEYRDWQFDVSVLDANY